MHNFWEQRLLTIATLVEEGNLPVHRRASAPARRAAGSMTEIPASRTAQEAAALIRTAVEHRVLTKSAFIGVLCAVVAWEPHDVTAEADFAEADRPTTRETDWTLGNASELFRAVVAEVKREVLTMSYRLLSAGFDDVAEAIVAHIAHNLRFGPAWPEDNLPLKLVAGGSLTPTAGAQVLDYIAAHTRGGSFHRVLMLDAEEVTGFPVMSAIAWFLSRAATAVQEGDAKKALAVLSALVDGAALSDDAFVAELHLLGCDEATIARVLSAVRRGQAATETMEVDITEKTPSWLQVLDGLPVRVAVLKLVAQVRALEAELHDARGGGAI